MVLHRPVECTAQTVIEVSGPQRRFVVRARPTCIDAIQNKLRLSDCILHGTYLGRDGAGGAVEQRQFPSAQDCRSKEERMLRSSVMGVSGGGGRASSI